MVATKPAIEPWQSIEPCGQGRKIGNGEALPPQKCGIGLRPVIEPDDGPDDGPDDRPEAYPTFAAADGRLEVTQLTNVLMRHARSSLLAIACGAIVISASAQDLPYGDARNDDVDVVQADDGGPVTLLVEEPYVVFVAQDQTHLRCGPSPNYYKTDRLRLGQELHVYVDLGDGWLGVRPVDSSFCWIEAEDVVLPQSRRGDAALTGRIKEDRTIAWIGTNLGRARRYHWMVRLSRNEEVRILGKSMREGPDGPTVWYRVTPPSGEFRWVHRDNVVTSAEQLIRQVAGSVEPSSRPAADFMPAARPRPVQPAATATPSLQPAPRSMADVTATPERPNAGVVTTASARRGHDTDYALVPATGPKFSPVLPAASGIATVAPEPGSPPLQFLPAPIRQASAQIDVPVDLPAADPQRLREVNAACQTGDRQVISLALANLISRGGSAAEADVITEATERLGLTDLAQRSRRYASIASRRGGSAALLMPLATPPALSSTAENTADPIEPTDPTAPAEPPTPSMTGTLTRVYSADPNRPPLALTDASGSTVAYVTPPVNFDATAMLGKIVTATGKIRPLADIGLPHVMGAEISTP